MPNDILKDDGDPRETPRGGNDPRQRGDRQDRLRPKETEKGGVDRRNEVTKGLVSGDQSLWTVVTGKLGLGLGLDFQMRELDVGRRTERTWLALRDAEVRTTTMLASTALATLVGERWRPCVEGQVSARFEPSRPLDLSPLGRSQPEDSALDPTGPPASSSWSKKVRASWAARKA